MNNRPTLPVHSGPTAVIPSSFAGADLVRAFIDALDTGCASYCILAGYDELPDTVTSDIDFMVSAEDFDRLPEVLHGLARRTDARLVQTFRHEITACYYILTQANGHSIKFLHPDACSDYRRHGRVWLRAYDVLRGRRWHSGGFWVPSAVDAFTYYLIKRIDKRELLPRHGIHLSTLFHDDREGCMEGIRNLWPSASVSAIGWAANSGDWSAITKSIAPLANQLTVTTKRDWSIKTLATEMTRRIGRVVRPTGVWIALLGPDGSGKSGVIEGLFSSLGLGFRRARYFHLRPRLLARGGESVGTVVTDPHGKAPRGRAASVAKLVFLLADYILGYVLRVRPLLVRSTLVIFDRYAHDMLVDTLRFRYGGPIWLLRLALRLVPQPDLILLLDAPAALLQTRKQEVSLAETERQRERYLALASNRGPGGRFRVISAAPPLDEVVQQCSREVLDWMCQRTEARLRLK